MAPIRPRGPLKDLSPQTVDSGTLNRSASAAPGPSGTGATHPDVPDPQLRELQELGLDLVQLAFDLAGIVDPTPVSDGASGLIALARGQWLDAVISGASMIPYVGDLAKAGKLPKYLKSLERAVELAEKSPKAAEALLPGLRKVKELLDLIPSGSSKAIDRMKEVVGRFVNARTGKAALKSLPDISARFKFRKFERNGKIYHEARGRLGVPGKVKTHRSKSAQQGVSSGTGDDAGHLIGDRFGAPGTADNLSPQNWITNRHGTFRQLEDDWAHKLKRGTGVEVNVTDITRKGEDRPFMRRVEWTETAPDGSLTTHQLTFTNTHTPRSRENRGIPPTVTSPQTNNVTPVDFVNKRKLP